MAVDLQIKAKRLLDEFRDAQQVQGVTLHILFESSPFFHCFVTVPEN
jgi:hypothetical protein